MASQTLLRLIARLQQALSVAQGRALLLDYARKSCGARLGLLFTLDETRQVLTLLEQSGRRPPSSAELELVELPTRGLFASALRHQGFLDIPDISTHALVLPEECALAWPHSRVLLRGLHQGHLRGVLVFCFGPAGGRALPTMQSQDELLITVSLLSAYMLNDEDFQTIRKISVRPQKPGRQRKPSSKPGRVVSEEDLAQVEIAPGEFVQALDLLTVLCELGLLIGTQMDRADMEQHILHLLGPALGVSAGGLWRYQSEEGKFVLQTVLGVPGELVERTSAELNGLAAVLAGRQNEPSSGVIVLEEKPDSMLIWYTLRSQDRLYGVLGLIFPSEPGLLAEQRLLLQTACDIIALILVHYNQHTAEQESLLARERGRIAHDIHDSAVQDIAHVTQKLDYIQRILEQQPQAALTEIEQARNLLNRSLHNLRDSISSLVPTPLEERPFEQALETLIQEYMASTPQSRVITSLEHLELWPQALHAPVYRFLQEALHNIRKHASASEVTIRIHNVPGLGIVEISDNGQGFQPEQARTASGESETALPRLGLSGMQERIQQAGGALEIRSNPGAGTSLKARFPLNQSSAILTEREREVLSLMVDGLTNRAIAEHLSVSLETVKSHVHHIMQKMHVKDRTQAAVLATRQQWL